MVYGNEDGAAEFDWVGWVGPGVYCCSAAAGAGGPLVDVDRGGDTGILGVLGEVVGCRGASCSGTCSRQRRGFAIYDMLDLHTNDRDPPRRRPSLPRELRVAAVVKSRRKLHQWRKDQIVQQHG